MKKQFIVALVLFASTIPMQAQTYVGKVKNGTFKMTIAQNEIRQKWENYLIAEKNLAVSLGNIEVKTSELGKYYLVASCITITNDTCKTKTTLAVRLDQRKKKYTIGNLMVYCTGCCEGCDIELIEDAWKCTPCKSEINNCNKSVLTTNKNSLF
jgi:hypothetical protein